LKRRKKVEGLNYSKLFISARVELLLFSILQAWLTIELSVIDALLIYLFNQSLGYESMVADYCESLPGS
jgi:hypothetical protein